MRGDNPSPLLYQHLPKMSNGYINLSPARGEHNAINRKFNQKQKVEGTKMNKENLIANLHIICNEANSHDNGYQYQEKISEWESADGSKSRTYFSITEKRNGSKHFAKQDYGYYDNITGEYFPQKYASLSGKLHTYSGAELV